MFRRLEFFLIQKIYSKKMIGRGKTEKKLKEDKKKKMKRESDRFRRVKRGALTKKFNHDLKLMA